MAKLFNRDDFEPEVWEEDEILDRKRHARRLAQKERTLVRRLARESKTFANMVEFDEAGLPVVVDY